MRLSRQSIIGKWLDNHRDGPHTIWLSRVRFVIGGQAAVWGEETAMLYREEMELNYRGDVDSRNH